MVNLEQFCGKKEPVFRVDDIRMPFSDEKYTYFTNGEYIIRVPLIEKYKDHIPPFLKYTVHFDNVPEATPGKYIPVPHFTMPEQKKCGHCLGKGTVDPCKECDAEGVVGCPWCDGEGFIYDFEEVRDEEIACPGNQILGKQLLAKLMQLPLFAIRETGLYNLLATHFVFYGGDGILMQRRNTYAAAES